MARAPPHREARDARLEHLERSPKQRSTVAMKSAFFVPKSRKRYGCEMPARARSPRSTCRTDHARRRGPARRRGFPPAARRRSALAGSLDSCAGSYHSLTTESSYSVWPANHEIATTARMPLPMTAQTAAVTACRTPRDSATDAATAIRTGTRKKRTYAVITWPSGGMKKTAPPISGHTEERRRVEQPPSAQIRNSASTSATRSRSPSVSREWNGSASARSKLESAPGNGPWSL